ncbi:Brain-specific angiogenesis inhibitor 1-associated protein 2 [Collichthys lucidus]|uniref:Brain-specific angiogenesis inhibitor 1-associated protein 2 n=1 Tax=Collichthys lucidus TaxID=240159 RepID=A0A4U5VM90_COLLU|nr:Brain-specific angiogenesis inhibitor 1-associated protein 2 [Collichthys lucidus]
MVLTDSPTRMSRTDEVHRITENVYKNAPGFVRVTDLWAAAAFASVIVTLSDCVVGCMIVLRGDDDDDHLRSHDGGGGFLPPVTTSLSPSPTAPSAFLWQELDVRHLGKRGWTQRKMKKLNEGLRLLPWMIGLHFAAHQPPWEVLFQMAEVHRQIQIQLEEMLKSFHNELLTELEKKVELDARYLNAALKKYQMEHKSKGESLEKCQAELKKLRRKSQGSKHPSKYGDKEMQVSVCVCVCVCGNKCVRCFE